MSYIPVTQSYGFLKSQRPRGNQEEWQKIILIF